MRVYYASRCVGGAEIFDCGAEYRLRAMVYGVPEGPFRLAAPKPGGGYYKFGVMMPRDGAYVLEKNIKKHEIDALNIGENTALLILYPHEQRENPARMDFTELGFTDELARRLNEYGELVSLDGTRLAAVRLASPGIDRMIHLVLPAQVIKSGGELYLAYPIPAEKDPARRKTRRNEPSKLLDNK